MKVAVSVPNEVFAAAERLVRSSGRSRSEVYASAVREYVARHVAEEVTEALDHVVSSLDDPRPATSFTDAAARRALASTEW